jgi:Family of unknown function (DUF6526)
MNTQDFKNHSRYVPLYHFVLFALLLAVFIGAIINLWHSEGSNLYSASLILALSLSSLLVFYFMRAFPLKAQDRAIRAEENFRHFVLTGKPFDSRLTMPQIIALRFAADAELPALARRAADENLSSKAIKAAIQNWRGDYHRL